MENSDGGAAKLEQFLILAKSARDKAAVALVKNVLTNKIYVFGELLEQPNIAAVSVPQPFLQRTHHTQTPQQERHTAETPSRNTPPHIRRGGAPTQVC
jgi:hypothetical protein